MMNKLINISLLTIAIGGCAAIVKLPSLPQGEPPLVLDSTERGMIGRCKDAHKQKLSKSRIEPKRTVLNRYVKLVANKIIKKNGYGKYNLGIYIEKSPTINAYSTPCGKMYFTYGLLAAMENEAQLAFVIGHELAHYTERHSLESSYAMEANSKRYKMLQAVAGPIMKNIPITLFQNRSILSMFKSNPYLFVGISKSTLKAAKSSIAVAMTAGLYSNGRDQERESDKVGFKYMRMARYDTAQAELAIANLSKATSGRNRPWSWTSTHPTIPERAASLRNMHLDTRASADRTLVNKERYLKIMRRYVYKHFKR